MEEVLLAFVVFASNAFCFALGARLGHASEKGEKAKVNPAIVTKTVKAKKEAALEKQKIDTIMWNIDNYDGTGVGQKDV